MVQIVKVKKGREFSFLYHHPWVFSGAIQNESSLVLKDGALVKVCDYQNQFLAWGFFNSKSQIRIRLYSFNEMIVPDEAFFHQKIESAIRMRKSILSQNIFDNACRLIFSEADCLSGLVVDKFSNYLSMQFTSLALYLKKEIIVQKLIELIHPKGIYLRTEKGTAEEEGLEIHDELVWGERAKENILISENNLVYELNIETGQKTGFYIDQRENRLAVRKYANHRKCADICSYSGGFSLNLLEGGADFVKIVDISDKALLLAERNIHLNQFNQAEFIRSDAFKFLENQLKDNQFYDLIVLDPPKFTHSRSSSKQAIKGYTQLNTMAMQCMSKGGILVTCSCSGRISKEEFFQAITNAAIISKRNIRLLEQRGAAIDHPVNPECPESAYLKCFIYWVE